MSIVENRKAFHDYFIEERFEAGLSLEGWEVKAVRAGRANLKEAYVIVKDGEIVLIGAGEGGVTPIRTYQDADARELGLIVALPEDDIVARPAITGSLLDRLRSRTVIK